METLGPREEVNPTLSFTFKESERDWRAAHQTLATCHTLCARPPRAGGGGGGGGGRHAPWEGDGGSFACVTSLHHVYVCAANLLVKSQALGNRRK